MIRRHDLTRLAFTGVAAMVALLVLAPLLWMVAVSLMPPGQAAQFPPPLWPAHPTLDNYRTLFQDYGIGRYALNSLLVSTLATALALLFVVPAGYAFAKLRFRGRDAIFQALVAALVVPGQIGMLPLFLELKAMGLVNSYAGAVSDAAILAARGLTLREITPEAYLGFFGTCLGFIWYYEGIREIGPSKAGVFINFVPISAVIMSFFLLGEMIDASLLIGGALVLSGIYITNRSTAVA